MKKARTGRLERLHLENVRCFAAVDIPLDEKVTVIVGENGAGKSTVIEALASLNYGAEGEGFAEFPLQAGLLSTTGRSGRAAADVSRFPRNNMCSPMGDTVGSRVGRKSGPF